MISLTSPVGIDVAKAHLDVSVEGARSFRVSNTKEGITDLLKKLPELSTVSLESSGGYERLVRRSLLDKGVTVIRHDPLRVRRFLQAFSGKAKTDDLDARGLARIGDSLPMRKAKSLEHEQLTDISRAIEKLKSTAADLKKSAASPELEETAKACLLAAAKDIETQAKQLLKHFDEKLSETPLKAIYDAALSVPCVGIGLARVLVCELPELSQMTTAQASCYSGLAPIDNSSGARKGTSRISRGCVRIKKALYMPAVCAVRHCAWATTLYKKLRANGKCHQAAAVAVMRRLLTIAVAVMKRGSAWVAEPSKT